MKVSEMRKKYPSMWVRGGNLFYDLSLINRVGDKEDRELYNELDKGYGAFGTAARLRVELSRELGKNPDDQRFTAEFTDPDGRIISVEVVCKKTFAYHDCRLQYSFVTAVDCQIKIIDKDRRNILIRKYSHREQPPKDAIVSKKGYVEEVFV